MITPDDLNLTEWNDLLEEYKKTPGFRPGAAMRIENTMFTSARRAGAMRFNGDMYTYFEPTIPGAKPNDDGTLYVAWLMVRDDFLKWAKAKLQKAKPDRKVCRWFDRYMGCCRNKPGQLEIEGMRMFIEPSCNPSDKCGWEAITAEKPAWDADMEDAL